MAEHYVVDIRNTMCPYPKYVVPQVLEQLRRSEEGTTLDILVDCPSAIDEIPAILNREGYRTETSQIKDGEWRIRAIK